MRNTLTLQIKLPNAATWGLLETASYDDAIKGMTLKAVTKTMQSRLVGWQGNYAQFRDAQFRIVYSAKPVPVVQPAPKSEWLTDAEARALEASGTRVVYSANVGWHRAEQVAA